MALRKSFSRIPSQWTRRRSLVVPGAWGTGARSGTGVAVGAAAPLAAAAAGAAVGATAPPAAAAADVGVAGAALGGADVGAALGGAGAGAEPVFGGVEGAWPHA